MHWNSCCCYSKAFWPEITAVARISPGKSSEIQLLWLCLFICFHITVMPEVTHMQSWKLSHSGKMSLGSFQGMEGAEGKPCTSPILSWAFVSWVLALAEWTCVSSSGLQSVLWNRKTTLAARVGSPISGVLAWRQAPIPPILSWQLNCKKLSTDGICLTVMLSVSLLARTVLLIDDGAVL